MRFDAVEDHHLLVSSLTADPEFLLIRVIHVREAFIRVSADQERCLLLRIEDGLIRDEVSVHKR